MIGPPRSVIAEESRPKVAMDDSAPRSLQSVFTLNIVPIMGRWHRRLQGARCWTVTFPDCHERRRT